MDMSSLIMAQMLECNRPLFDAHEFDEAMRKAVMRHEKWQSRMARVRSLWNVLQRRSTVSAKLANGILAK